MNGISHGKRRIWHRLFDEITLANFDGKKWSDTSFAPATAAIAPASHVLHYASTCFEGMKLQGSRWIGLLFSG